MAIDQHSYSNHFTRPRPEVYVERNNQLMVVATPWGPRSSAKKAVQIIQDYFLSSRNDRESTSPFAKLDCLSPVANDLRSAIKLANDSIYNEENKNEFVSGIELTVLASHGLELCWVQIGHPYILLDRKGSDLQVLGNSIDLSYQHQSSKQTLAPLPQKLLGLDRVSDFEVNSLRMMPEDRFLLLSRSSLPKELFKISAKRRTVSDISYDLSQKYSDQAFWLASFTP